MKYLSMGLIFMMAKEYEYKKSTSNLGSGPGLITFSFLGF
jgi:hypothetical protein